LSGVEGTLSKEFDDFVAGELKKLKKKYPDTHIMRHVSMVSEEDIPEEDSDLPEELDVEMEADEVYDEAKEFED